MPQTFRSRITSAGAGDGTGIAVAATASPGTLLYSTQANANLVQEVMVEIANTTNAAIEVGVQWGGVASKDLQPVPLGPKQTVVVSKNLQKGTALEVRAYMVTGAASAANAWAYGLEEVNT